MTTIVISAPEMKVYTDTCASHNSTSSEVFLHLGSSVYKQNTIQKILYSRDKIVVGTGNYNDLVSVYKTVTTEETLEKPEGETNAYVVSKGHDGSLRIIKYVSCEEKNDTLWKRLKYLRYGTTYRWKTEVLNLSKDETIFDGSGGRYARGMFVSSELSISEIIKKVSMLDTFTNDHIHCFDLNKWDFV